MLSRCSQCSFLFTNPRPALSNIGKYYQSDRYVSHAANKSGLSFMYRIYDWVRNYSIGQKIRLIRKYNQSGKLMDLGCGLGHFLNGVVQSNYFDAIGVDISDDAIQYVKKTFGYTVLPESSLSNQPSASLDVITQWHVLEHVHLLNDRMATLKRILNPEGTMFIAVPNSNSWDAKYYQSFWDGYDVPRHLYHFNQQSFTQLIEKHGFKVVQVLPMVFDAPYISMRSEVHQHNSIPFIKGAFFGSVSTIKALFSKEYSSLLFVVKHQ
ncbi:MAG: class I SAM-dependent methyltransferase [Bacteroidia bacterium]|nr:class I SAM-dependent methyltransferase [Bacteroidia bacterium]